MVVILVECTDGKAVPRMHIRQSNRVPNNARQAGDICNLQQGRQEGLARGGNKVTQLVEERLKEGLVGVHPSRHLK